MFSCKYCGIENDEGNSFCSNCGNLLVKEGENKIILTLKIIGRGVINPHTYIRNSKNLDLIFSGIMSGILLIIYLLQSFFLSRTISMNIPIIKTSDILLGSILINALYLVVNTVICYGVLRVLKRNVRIREIINIYLFASIITNILAIVPILIIKISITIAFFLLFICVFFGYGIIYIGLKDTLEVKTKYVFLVIMLCYVGNLIVNSVLTEIFM